MDIATKREEELTNIIISLADDLEFKHFRMAVSPRLMAFLRDTANLLNELNYENLFTESINKSEDIAISIHELAIKMEFPFEVLSQVIIKIGKAFQDIYENKGLNSYGVIIRTNGDYSRADLENWKVYMYIGSLLLYSSIRGSIVTEEEVKQLDKLEAEVLES